MTELETAARKALDALEALYEWPGADDQCKKAVDALRAALAREKAEPVAVRAEPVVGACDCHRCIKEYNLRYVYRQYPVGLDRMILCPSCGNKRCPKASDHRLDCTNSNEPGQPGSVYTAQAEPVVCPLEIHPIHAKYCSAQVCDVCKAQKAEPVASEALRLAEFCDFNVLYQPAAAELRRQHAEITRLEARERGREIHRGLKIEEPPDIRSFQQDEPVQAEPVVEPVLTAGIVIQAAWRMGYDAAKAEQVEQAEPTEGNPSF